MKKRRHHRKRPVSWLSQNQTFVRLKPKARKFIKRFLVLIFCLAVGFIFYSIPQTGLQYLVKQTQKIFVKKPAAPPVKKRPSGIVTKTQPVSAIKPAPTVLPHPPAVKPVVQPSVKKPLWLFPRKHKVSAAKPKIAIVIDDIGYNQDHVDLLENLGDRITYAILPHLQHSKFFSDLSQSTGAEVILHLPLEPLNELNPGPGKITSGMSRSEILNTLNGDLESVPARIGVNNHMGSKITQDPEMMKLILEALKERGFFFFDSFTTSRSVGYTVAREIGLPAVGRDIFLDNVLSESAIENQLVELAYTARKKGYAIGIGHYHYETLKTLNRVMPMLQEEGFELITLSDLLGFLKDHGKL